MLAVVKMPHTKITLEGHPSKSLVTFFKMKFREKFKVIESDSDDDVLIDPTNSDWFKDVEKKSSPGDALKIYRENMKWSQQELGDKLGGMTRFYVSDMETGKRSISKNIAKELAKLFDAPVEFFI